MICDFCRKKTFIIFDRPFFLPSKPVPFVCVLKGGLELVGRLLTHLGRAFRPAGGLLYRVHAGEQACFWNIGRRKRR